MESNKGDSFMKNVFKLLVIMALASHFAQATDLYFTGGVGYSSEYEEGIGRASLIMTGSPGYVLISTNQNKCEKGACYLVGYESDINSMLYQLNKMEEQNDLVKYEAIPVPFTDLGKKQFIPDFESKLKQIKITIEADLSWENTNAWTMTHRRPKNMNMKVEYKGHQRLYRLKI